jgi:hypothetical protein
MDTKEIEQVDSRAAIWLNVNFGCNGDSRRINNSHAHALDHHHRNLFAALC